MKRGPKPLIDMQWVERFLSRVEMTHNCWEWVGPKNFRGYGHTTYKDRTDWLAHRLSYLLFIGEFDKSLRVCHHCDNPGCVRPSHLFLGTAKENTHDAISKGRFVNIQDIKEGKYKQKESV